MESFQYTISTDAFTLGGYSFPAETFSFTRDHGQFDASLAGLTFDGWQLGTAHVQGGILNIWGIHSTALESYSAVSGEFQALWAPFMLPDFLITTTPKVIYDGTIGVGIHEFASVANTSGVYPSYGWGTVHGTITETAFNLPEPGYFFLMAIGLIAIFANRRRKP